MTEEIKYYNVTNKTDVAKLLVKYDDIINIKQMTGLGWHFIKGNEILFKYYGKNYYYQFSNCSIEHDFIDEIIEKLKKIKGISDVEYIWGDVDDDDEWDDLL